MRVGVRVSDAVERLAAHAQQVGLLRAAGLAHPSRRLGDDLGGVGVGVGLVARVRAWG